jgi:hypothetical protein
VAQTGPWLPHVVVESRLGLTGFLPKVYKNNFEGAFSRVKVRSSRRNVFASRSPLGKSPDQMQKNCGSPIGNSESTTPTKKQGKLNAKQKVNRAKTSTKPFPNSHRSNLT